MADLTDQTEDTSPSSSDIGYSVKDPAGTPLPKKATWLNILKGAALGVLTSDGDLFTRTSGALARLTRASLAADSAFTGTYVAKATVPEVLVVAISDETTAITTGTAKVTFRMPFAMTLTAVRASLTTASSSGNPTFDINEAGTTILSTKLSIDSGEKTSTTAATAAVISDSALADDAEITIDVDTAGTGATGAKIYLIGTRSV